MLQQRNSTQPPELVLEATTSCHVHSAILIDARSLQELAKLMISLRGGPQIS